MDHGKPKAPEGAAPARIPAPDVGVEGVGCQRTMRKAALQQGLRAAYRTVIEEPLPDRLLSLLQQLDGEGPSRR